MIDIKSMVENESVEDVIMVLAPKLDYSRIDSWYVQNRFEVIQNGLLIRNFEKLLNEGKLYKDEKGEVFQGPNWQPPQFVKDKKYGIK
jgi:hypothetical protein